MKKWKLYPLWARISIISLVVLLLGSVIAAYALREPLLKNRLAKIQQQLQQEYQTTLDYQAVEFVNWNTVSLHQVSLLPAQADTLLQLEKAQVSVNLWKALRGGIQLQSLEVHNGYLQLVRDSSGTNFQSFLRPKKRAQSAVKTDRRTRAERIYDLLENLLDKVPTQMQMSNLELRVQDYNYQLTLDLNALTLDGNQIQGQLRVQDTSAIAQQWELKGTAQPRKHQFDVRVYGQDTSGIRLPWIDHKYHFLAQFDSLRMQLSDLTFTQGELRVHGSGSFAGMRINHRRIATQDVEISQAKLDYLLRVGGNEIELDSSSVAQFNRVVFNPYARVSYAKDTVYSLKLHLPKMQAQDFISSLPAGLFSQVAGMQTSGEVGFDLDFEYNKNQPDSVRLDSKLYKNNFKILHYGPANLAKINGEFTYRAWDNGQLQRPILVGQANPNYAPLESISPYLKNALLTTEDPSFYHHLGFSQEAFRQSIQQNIASGRFVRGASTISMQLVKNVFLTRDKTMGRKLEEILLVYLLENHRVVSKTRMYEVYLNIIEWGPNVYGITEAAQYYFQKTPAELNLDESLYLANIVPRPKRFAAFFQADGSLRPWVEQKNAYLKKLMLRRGLITEADTLTNTVILSGRARERVVKETPDSTAIDSLERVPIQELKSFLEAIDFKKK